MNDISPLKPGTNVATPRVVYDQKMPPYRYQDFPMGVGWCGSDGRGGFYTYGKKP